jgi:polyhydroxyalkanoate synthase subunit PhaE
MAADQTAQNNDWFKAQQQYWDTWFQGQRQFFEQPGNANPAAGLSGQWESFFREWQKLTAGDVPAADTYRQFFTQAGKGFLDMMEQFCQTGASQAPEESLKAWTANMQKFFASILQANAQPFDAGAQFKSFTETFTAAGPAFWGDMFKNPMPGQDKPHNAAGFMFDPFGFYASVPGVGYTREKQDHLNLLYRLWVDYEGQMRRYNIEMTKTGLQALQRFQEYVANPPAGDAPLDSLKDIYIKFVDISEDVYAEFALSEEYTKMYGEVVNALSAFKKQMHQITDDMMEQANLPNRQEVDSLHKRVHELRRENLQHRKDIAELKAALGLKTKPAAKAAAKPAATKAAPTPIKKTATDKPKAKPAKAAKAAKPAKKKAGKK